MRRAARVCVANSCSRRPGLAWGVSGSFPAKSPVVCRDPCLSSAIPGAHAVRRRAAGRADDAPSALHGCWCHSSARGAWRGWVGGVGRERERERERVGVEECPFAAPCGGGAGRGARAGAVRAPPPECTAVSDGGRAAWMGPGLALGRRACSQPHAAARGGWKCASGAAAGEADRGGRERPRAGGRHAGARGSRRKRRRPAAVATGNWQRSPRRCGSGCHRGERERASWRC